jgi:hypothetical protein
MTIACKVVYEDESTDEYDADFVNSLSMRGAQREITGHFITEGYQPVGRWTTEAVSDGRGDLAMGDPIETWRRFKLAE